MNHKYYQGPTGHHVMNGANYCHDIVGYLDQESTVVGDCLVHNGYRALIELGCDHLRLMPIAVEAGADYLRVDSRRELRQKNLSECRMVKSIKARYFCANIENFAGRIKANKKSGPGHMENALCVLPFNLFGNLGSPVDTCMAFMDSGADILLSSFNPTSTSRRIRSSYYKKCMIEPEFISLPEYGHVFFDSKHPFMSVSMTPELINKLFLVNECEIETVFKNEVAYIVKIKKKKII